MRSQEIVWRANKETVERSITWKFMRAHGISRYEDLVQRSIDEPEWLWASVVDFLGIPFAKDFSEVRDLSRGVEFGHWFVGGALNASEICVDRWAKDTPDKVAIHSIREDGLKRSLTYEGLCDEVSRCAGWLRSIGVVPGDAIACFMPLTIEAAVAFLAVARVGGLFVPIFSGFGAEAIATRLEDARPKVLFTADRLLRRGRTILMKEVADAAVKIAGCVNRVVVVPYLSQEDTPWNSDRDITWSEVLMAEPVEPTAVDSEAPLLLAYTSGTTGRPKGIVLPHGGTTVKIIQEGAFQLDYQRDDVATWVTDMGWIMGPWLIMAALGNGATSLLIDGPPDYPDPGVLWRIVDEFNVTALGISPTLIRSLQSHGDGALEDVNLNSLRILSSTGEPWNPSPWWWLFKKIGKGNLPIINMTGGTEVGACLLSVNVLQGIKPCSVGGPSLGLAVDVFDEIGEPLIDEVGELVVTQHWPAATRGFWHDDKRYLETYWDRWSGVWVHGDWAYIDKDGFWYLQGRSDDTLNIAGKRIGPAEIENAAVAHPEVTMAAAIGIPDELKGERIVVYVVPVPSRVPNDYLTKEIEEAIVDVVGKAFRPKEVFVVSDLPRTRSQKIMRRVIRSLALGLTPGDLSTMENPESLENFTPI